MKQINLFTSNLEGRARIQEISKTNKATAAALANFAASIDAEFTKVIKDQDRRARNVANAAKGKYQTAAGVVANCFPYQTAAGELLTKVVTKDETGAVASKTWEIKKLTRAAAAGIVKDSLKNFTRTIGAPVVEIHAAGDPVE